MNLFQVPIDHVVVCHKSRARCDLMKLWLCYVSKVILEISMRILEFVFQEFRDLCPRFNWVDSVWRSVRYDISFLCIFTLLRFFLWCHEFRLDGKPVTEKECMSSVECVLRLIVWNRICCKTQTFKISFNSFNDAGTDVADKNSIHWMKWIFTKIRISVTYHQLSFIKWSFFGAFEFKIWKNSFDRKPKHELT